LEFKDVTMKPGWLAAIRLRPGLFCGFDGDGDLDLLVTSMGGPNACFINDGTGHFKNATAEAELLSKWGSNSMALADVDGDGTLDLYVANYEPLLCCAPEAIFRTERTARAKPWCKAAIQNE